MSAKEVEKGKDRKVLHVKQNVVDVVKCMTGANTAAAETEMIGIAAAALGVTSERTNTSGETRTTTAPTTTMSVDENDWASENFAASSTIGIDGLSMSPGSGRSGTRRRTEQCSDGSDKNNSKRKTRRGKTNRGKRSSSSRPYSKSQWKFHVPLLRTTTANKRRVKVSLRGLTSRSAGIITTDPFILSDQPPLVPYNTNRFLMEDHMPHVLTPSEDEEEFLTKEFSSVYEDARSERLEGLSKGQLIQEYLQLEANYEQVTRRFNAVKSLSIKEENDSAVNNATTVAATKDATPGCAATPVVTVDRRRLEDKIRELTTENLELRRQLEHASRIGMVLTAKSSPRNYSGTVAAAIVEQMDSSSYHGTSSEDSESDSSSSSSSSNSDKDDDGSSSSMSDDDNDEGDMVRLVTDDNESKPLVVAMEETDEESKNNHQNCDLLADNEEGKSNEPLSPLSVRISSPPPPLVTN